MKEATFILRDQLNLEFSVIKNASLCVMCELTDWADLLPHHKKKIVLHFSSMRHFSDELIKEGKSVLYYPMCEDLDHVLKELKTKDHIEMLHIMEPSEYGIFEEFEKKAKKAGIAVKMHPNEQFIYQDKAFDFTRPPMLENFYRYLRRSKEVLMHGAKPVGGAWNFDKENRQKAPEKIDIPGKISFKPDEITRKVIKEVEERFSKNFGSTDGFDLAVDRKQALKALHDFIEHKLDLFGPYQDAMLVGEAELFHSLLSPYLNINLLRPLEVIKAVEEAYHHKKARLASVEGFIRQILGWREFVYQVYKANMPKYKKLNHFNYKLDLPSFFWDAKTKMKCCEDAVSAVISFGINHHIQRLMVTGNFSLIAGIDPHQVNDWYHFAYIDAFDWVVTPNVLGLSLYADGGMIATKPYASSAQYIQKMSNYCKNCAYNYKTATDEDSCPFNSLYWDFIQHNKKEFLKNQRMALMVGVWDKKKKSEQEALISKGEEIKKALKKKEKI